MCTIEAIPLFESVTGKNQSTGRMEPFEILPESGMWLDPKPVNKVYMHPKTEKGPLPRLYLYV